jgi:hypothetical protein
MNPYLSWYEGIDFQREGAVQIRWLILVSLTLARTAMAFQFQLVPALSAIYI